MRMREMSAGEKAREETPESERQGMEEKAERPLGREAGAVLTSSTAMEKEAEAELESGGVGSEPVLEHPVASRSAGRRRKTPGRLLRGRKFHGQIITAPFWKALGGASE
jgi:hypothetical protein